MKFPCRLALAVTSKKSVPPEPLCMQRVRLEHVHLLGVLQLASSLGLGSRMALEALSKYSYIWPS